MDVFDGSVVNGLRHPILFSFILDKPAGCKVFCEPETIQFEKIIKSFWNTIPVYLEKGNHEKLILTKKQ